MAHYQQLKFVELVSLNFPEFFKQKRVLEIGSWIANETIRKFFLECDYVGADVASGPGVDIVCPGEKLDFPSDSFDVVVSCECFEHNSKWEETFINMHRMLKPGGLFMMTCATIGRGEHGTNRKSPNASLTVSSGHADYYKNISKGDLVDGFDLNNMFDQIATFYNIYFCDLYFIGFKKSTAATPQIPKKFVNEVNNITNAIQPRLIKRIEKFLNFWLTFYYARLVGEKNYHNLKYTLGAWLKK